MHIANSVGLRLVPYSRGEHWLSDMSLYSLTSPLVSAPTSAHSHPVLTSPLPINWHLHYGSFDMHVVSCYTLLAACNCRSLTFGGATSDSKQTRILTSFLFVHVLLPDG